MLYIIIQYLYSMLEIYRNRIFIFFLAILAASSLSVDPNDLLSGTGLFSTASLGSFTNDGSHTASFHIINSTNVLKLVKPTTSSISYKQGLLMTFAASQVKHVSFQFSSITTDTEDANLRLIDSTNNLTIVLFRAGKGGFARVNQNQMVTFYNGSVTLSDTQIITMKIDLLLKWSEKTIDIFVGGVYSGNCNFFTTGSNSVDTIMLYNLYQSTSYWKNIVVCSDICYSFSNGKHVLLSLVLLALMIFVL